MFDIWRSKEPLGVFKIEVIWLTKKMFNLLEKLRGSTIKKKTLSMKYDVIERFSLKPLQHLGHIVGMDH